MFSVFEKIMIQRIQSIYLLLVILLSAVGAFLLPLWYKEDGSAVLALDQLTTLAFFGVSAVLALITIFLFKNRKLQFVLGRLNIILNFILLGFFVYWSQALPGEMQISEKGIVKAVAYSNNLKPIIQELHKKFNVTEYTKMKSSFKFCVVAAGEFDLYIAEPRASEWDIAAGHAILQNAGGLVTDFDGNEILYGKKDFKNPSLIIRRSKNL